MLRGLRLLRAPRVWACILLFWFVLPGPVALLDSFDSPLPPGILDGDDDDDALTSLSDLDLKPLAPIPSPRLDILQRVGRAAPVETLDAAPAGAALPTPSRSPPLL